LETNSSEEIKAFGSCLDRAILSCGESIENRAGGSQLETNFLFKDGKPRLAAAKSYFFDLGDLDFKGLVDYYKTWRSFNEYLLLERIEGDKREWFAVKCSKRGNDVYWSRISKRLAGLKDQQDIEFFNPKDRGSKTTRAIFVTLTYDSKLGSINDAWEEHGNWWNRWITNLRDKFGELSYIRTWESFINGYPHVHALLIFKDHEFNVFRQRGKDGKYRFRIQEKEQFESSWHSNVDVQACSSLRKASLYITKYLTKGFHESSEEALDKSLRGLTLSMNWIFRKRSFAVSRDLFDLISDLRNSKSQVLQSLLTGGSIPVTWRFLGIFSAAALGISDNSWYTEISRAQLPDLEAS
jgi:hypothetical protein